MSGEIELSNEEKFYVKKEKIDTMIVCALIDDDGGISS